MSTRQPHPEAVANARRDVSAHFHPVLRASRLRRKPVGVTLGGVHYVIWRDARGTPRALHDRCPHRHAPLSRGFVRPDGRIACAYHGWHFDGNGEGASPAVTNLGRCTAEAFAVVEHHGWLWLGGPRARVDGLPVLGGDGWDFVGSHAQRAAAPLHVVVDNFSENEHTPYVHGRLGWTEATAPQVSVETTCHADRTEVTYRAIQRPSTMLKLVLVRDGDEFWNQWVTRFSPVHSVYTISWRDPRTGEPRPFAVRVAVCFVPVDAGHTDIVSFTFTQLAPGRYRVPRRVRDLATHLLGWKEVWDDVRWVRHIADTQVGFEGMRLTRFDKPLSHNRKLMESLYYGASDPSIVQISRA
jgi:phenylpropionate dioxygenase-like ring-hydroxylating dioxygenase large terminal subunit